MIRPAKYNASVIPVLSDAAPAAIGGIGGSGTRAIAQVLMALGFDMGSDLNDSLDDLSFTALFKRGDLWPLESHYEALEEALAVYLTSRGVPSPLEISKAEQRYRAEALLGQIAATALWRETGDIRGRLHALTKIPVRQPLWGWKEPNAHIVLPYLLKALPRLRYIHVLRDGRDMAYSANKNQLGLWGSRLLGRPTSKDSPQDALDYWCVVHRRLLDLRQQNPQRILLVRLESCLDDTLATLNRIFDFLNAEPQFDQERVTQLFTEPQSIGRYRAHPSLSMTQEQIQLFGELGYPSV